ncbi:hypothetical protein EMCRGX_G021120 [Ephydatia muelleri]
MASCMEHFRRSVAKLVPSRDAAVAVAVSGGSDSVALTYLARQVFQRVVGITVDHRLRPESSQEAVKTGSIVTGIGAEHHVIPLEWPARPDPGKVQLAARQKRYEALFRFCREKKIRYLMTAHHMDDQLGTFLTRLSMGSSIDGLAGMKEAIAWYQSPETRLLRPLLHCTKVCTENHLDWVEDPSNASDVYKRNRINKALAIHSELRAGLGSLVETCSLARDVLQKKALHAMSSNGMVHVDQLYGYAKVSWPQYCHLDRPVAKRVLLALSHYTSGQDAMPHYLALSRAHQMLTEGKAKATNMTLGMSILVPADEVTFIVSRSKPPNSSADLTPIVLGETILWDKRFEITLSQLEPHTPPTSKQFYVRHMLTVDWELARKGIRKVRTVALPPEMIRGGLPVIVNEDRKVVLIPHFKVIERSAGVACKLKFAPQKSLEYCLLGCYEMEGKCNMPL